MVSAMKTIKQGGVLEDYWIVGHFRWGSHFEMLCLSDLKCKLREQILLEILRQTHSGSYIFSESSLFT